MFNKYRYAIAAFLMVMAAGLPTAGLSFFTQPVSQALGVGQGNFTLYYSLILASGALTSPFIGQIVARQGVRLISLISGLWGCIGLCLFSVSDALWMFYDVAIFTGAMTIGCMTLCANVTVQTYYSPDEAAGILGIVMAGSGFSSMAISALLPNVIAQWGWNTGYRVLGIAWLVFLWIAAFILGKGHANQQNRQQEQTGEGMTRKEALSSKVLYLLAAMYVLLCFCAGVQQYLPSILNSFSFSSDQVAAMMAVFSAALAIGKILQGKLYGKIGIRLGGLIIIGFYIAGFLLMNTKATVVAALIAIAIGMGIVTTLIPLMAKKLFGSREYASIWGMISMVGTMGAFIATPLWGVIYDVSGGYLIALLASALCLVAAMLLHTHILKQKQS